MNDLAPRRVKKSRIPARLDVAQSLSGLALAVFLWTHLFLVSSILLGKDAMQFVTDLLEVSFLDPSGEGYPLVVSGVGVFISFLFILHAFLAMRKLPINFKQLTTYRDHMGMMHHGDTTTWWQQAATGFVLFFLGSVHLYVITTNSHLIGPDASSDRVYGWMAPLYLLLLFAAEVHAAAGVYRLTVKWGLFDGATAKATRRNLQVAKYVATAFFVGLGLASLVAYWKIGFENASAATPTHQTH